MESKQRVYRPYCETLRLEEEIPQRQLLEIGRKPQSLLQRPPAKGVAWGPCFCPYPRLCLIQKYLLRAISGSTYSETHSASAKPLVVLARPSVSPSFGTQRHKRALGL